MLNQCRKCRTSDTEAGEFIKTGFTTFYIVHCDTCSIFITQRETAADLTIWTGNGQAAGDGWPAHQSLTPSITTKKKRWGEGVDQTLGSDYGRSITVTQTVMIRVISALVILA